MADISALSGLQAGEPLEGADYPDANEPQPLPKKGRYVVQAPASFPDTSFGTTKAGFLQATIDPTIVGPSNEGANIRFSRVSAKVFKRKGRNVSQVGDYLRACGVPVPTDGDPAKLADAVEQTAGRNYQVDLDWEVYDGKGEQPFEVKGMENFPADGNGGHQPYVVNPYRKDDAGEPVLLRANVRIQRFIAAS